MRTLVLPGGLSESLEYRQVAMARGERLVGASSIPNDPAARFYDTWCYVPPVHDPHFDHAFREAVARLDVAAVYCPHAIVYERLRALSEDPTLRLRLINRHPAKMREDQVEARLAEARSLWPYVRACGGREDVPSELEVAGLLRAVAPIPGQSDDVKLASMMAVFPSLPQGDVVEIGAYWGRSAFVLTWLAARYNIGAVLAVDAWSAALAVQREAPELVQRDTFTQDWDVIHQGFLMNVLPVAPGRLGYLRVASQEGAARYAGLKILESPPFGPVRYSGRIALLHVDGNHGLKAVRSDVAAWRGFVRSGGWIVLDDYVWLHGSGPQRVGDALLAEMGDQVARSFVAGKALFLELM